MKKRYIVLLLVFLFALAIYAFFQQTAEDMKTAVPPNPTSQTNLNPEPPQATKDDMIVVSAPLENQVVHTPLVIRGKARGGWYSEGSFPVMLVNGDGRIIAEGTAKATGNWMSTEYVAFIATLNYTIPAGSPSNRGTLILKRDNPSGDPSHDSALEITVTLS